MSAPPQLLLAQTRLREALALHQDGQLEQARPLYEAVLKIQPKNADALHLLGVLSAQTGDHRRAADLIGRAIAVNSSNPAFHFNLGSALQQLGRFDEALTAYNNGLALRPDAAEAFNNRGNVFQALRRFDEALASYDRAIALRADNPQAHNNRGNALQALERHEEAIASYNRAVALKPDYALAFLSRGDALQNLQRHEEANESYLKALAINPYLTEAHYNRGNAVQALGGFDEALVCYENALVLKPDHAGAFYNRGNALQALERFEEAIACYDKVLAMRPDSAESHANRGLALHALKRFDEAVASFDRGVALNADNADLYSNRGLALQELKQFDAALADYDAALSLDPNHAEAYNNRGVVLQALKQSDAALASYEAALTLKPDNAEAYTNRGNLFQELKRFDDALACYDAALRITPDNAKLHGNRAIALQELKRFDESLASYEKALAAAPDFLFGTYLHAKMQACDWNSLPDNLAKLEAGISQSKRMTTPFAALTLLDAPDLLLDVGKVWTGAKFPPPRPQRTFRRRHDDQKIRVGYYSADFHDHATMYLIAELLEEHDRERFELFGFSFGPDADDGMRRRVVAALDGFHDVRGLSDADVAEKSASLGIDIAVDLKGFTGDSRAGIFAERCAPIQVNYLGYPATTGADFIDYIIADKVLIPPESRRYFSEKAVYLPHSYQPNDSKRRISDRIFTRAELGLPAAGFVFCCLNNTYKIFPERFDSWMGILKAVDGSVLWLLEDNATAAANLRKHAEARGVDGRRLIFAERMALGEHLARQKAADLFLDTLPCNAHTTASDALWAGLPVLTLAGKSFAGRVAASLLHAIDLPELVTDSAEDYEAKAIEIARSPGKAGELKRRLEANKASSPLFQTKQYAKHIEGAYKAMYDRFRKGLGPDVIEIEAQA
jgi:predicted O-linked N-acetylglucosamine transferase (SPINDLY family)